MLLLAAALSLAQKPKVITAMEDGYVLQVTPDADGRGAETVLSGPGLDLMGPLEIGWKLHLDFLPRAARVNGLGRAVLLGDDRHAVVVVGSEGKIVGDYPLADLLMGKALQTARDRAKRGRMPFDAAGFEDGTTAGDRFEFGKVRGVRLKRPPRHEGYTIWQGTVMTLGESAFYVRVGRSACAWFDPVDGELLSTDVPSGRKVSETFSSRR